MITTSYKNDKRKKREGIRALYQPLKKKKTQNYIIDAHKGVTLDTPCLAKASAKPLADLPT